MMLPLEIHSSDSLIEVSSIVLGGFSFAYITREVAKAFGVFEVEMEKYRNYNDINGLCPLEKAK